MRKNTKNNNDDEFSKHDENFNSYKIAVTMFIISLKANTWLLFSIIQVLEISLVYNYVDIQATGNLF